VSDECHACVASGLKLFVLKTEAVYSSESYPFIWPVFYLAYTVGHLLWTGLSRRIWLVGEPPTPDLSQKFLSVETRDVAVETPPRSHEFLHVTYTNTDPTRRVTNSAESFPIHTFRT
jgi:hypothetical protein